MGKICFVRRPLVCSLFMFDLFICPHSVFLSICLSHIIQKSKNWAWPYKLSTRGLAWTGTEQPTTLVFRLQCKRTAWGILITARCNKHQTFLFFSTAGFLVSQEMCEFLKVFKKNTLKTCLLKKNCKSLQSTLTLNLIFLLFEVFQRDDLLFHLLSGISC